MDTSVVSIRPIGIAEMVHREDPDSKAEGIQDSEHELELPDGCGGAEEDGDQRGSELTGNGWPD